MMLPVFAVMAACVFLAAVMSGAWLMQRVTGNAGWSDAFWSLGLGLSGSALALVPVAGADYPTTRQLVVAALVAVWGLRLGGHIAQRSLSGPEDARYAQFRKEWGANFQRRLFTFLQIQAGAGAFLALSMLVAAQNPQPEFRIQDWAAIAVLAVAVIGEGIADRQLRVFARNPQNRGKVCDEGLWAWSRHPNYFFEWTGWFAYALFAIDLSGDYPWGWLALTGPAFMYWLLVHVSGIPPLEAHMLRSRGRAFADYQKRVPAFFPRPPRQTGGSARTT
jgi:steroid 5-alpha reductase family enzyme